MKYALFALTLLLVVAGCKKKELPVAVNGTPIFRFIGNIGGDSVRFQAGADKIYMYSGYFKDTQNLITIKSYFAKDNCTNCEPYLSFEVKDFDETNTNGLAGTIADILKVGGTFNSYSLDSIFSTQTIERFEFTPTDNNVGVTYNWNFGDGGTSTMMSPSHIFTGGGMRNVRLITQQGGLIDSITNVINTDPGSSCRAQFTTLIDSFSNSVIVNATPAGFTYSWDFGNGSTGMGSTDTTIYTSSGKFVITLTASSPACGNIVFKQKVNKTIFPQALANYNYQTYDTTISALLPRINKSAFIITWIKNNVEYRSYKNVHGINQSGNPVFTFTGLSPYIKNEHGDPTIKVTGTVDTYLYNVKNAQDSIKIKSNDIVLAAAYPE